MRQFHFIGFYFASFFTVFIEEFLEGDPTNYQSYYRRATVYLAMGKSKAAVPDLDRVIELKPDFIMVPLSLFLFFF